MLRGFLGEVSVVIMSYGKEKSSIDISNIVAKMSYEGAKR